VTFPGAILGAIESLTCGPHASVVPHVSDSMAPRMAPGNVTESQSRALDTRFTIVKQVLVQISGVDLLIATLTQ
jgi:hypothetical protein